MPRSRLRSASAHAGPVKCNNMILAKTRENDSREVLDYRCAAVEAECTVRSHSHKAAGDAAPSWCRASKAYLWMRMLAADGGIAVF